MSVSRIVHNSQHCRKASFGTSRHGYRLRSSEPNATSLAFCRKQNSVSLCSQRSSKSLSSGIELAQVAFDLDSETITTIVAAVLGVGAGLGVPIFFVMQVSNWPSNCKLDCHDTSAFPCPEFAPATGPSVLLHTYSHLFYAQQTGRARQRAS